MSFRRLFAPGLALILASCSRPPSEPAATSQPAPPVPKTEPAPPAPTPAPTSKEPGKDATQPALTKNTSPPTKAGELTEQALKTAERGDRKKAVTLLDQALAVEPDNHDALWLLAGITRQQAMEEKRPKSSPLFLKYAELMRKLRATSKPMSPPERKLLEEALYNEACTYAVEGKKEQAMKSLTEAVNAGFDQSETIATDLELDSLRRLPEFQKLKKKVEEKAVAQAKEHAKEALANTKPFKFDFELPDLNGKKVALADFKGKVTIVDIWGTWCPPCRMEIPHFVALYQKYHDTGLEIVGINYEREDDEKQVKETIKSFVEKHTVPYPCLIGDDKTQDQIPNFEGFPTTLFIDRAGTVRAKLVGFDPSHARDLRALVEALLNEKHPQSAANP